MQRFHFVSLPYPYHLQEGLWPGGYSAIIVTGVLVGNFENTPKGYQNLVLWACPKVISTPKRYQFNNNK